MDARTDWLRAVVVANVWMAGRGRSDADHAINLMRNKCRVTGRRGVARVPIERTSSPYLPCNQWR